MTSAQAVNVAQAPALRRKPDGKLDPAGEAGWFLERERSRKSMSLAQVREATGIPIHHIIAIENGHINKLPPVDEAIAIVAAYGDFLGFDPAPLCAHYIRLIPPTLSVVSHPAPQSGEPAQDYIATATARPRPRFSQPDARLIAVSVAAILAIFAVTGWKLNSIPEAPAATADAIVSPAPVETAAIPAPAPAPAPTLPAPVAPPADLIAEEAGTALQGLGALINETVAAVDASGIGPRAEPLAIRGSEKSETPFVEEGGKRIYGPENTDSRLLLEARGQVWLRVEDTQGNVVATLNMSEGDQYRVPRREDLVVIARDGGLISYRIDGAEKGTLGKPGDILVGQAISMAALGG